MKKLIIMVTLLLLVATLATAEVRMDKIVHIGGDTISNGVYIPNQYFVILKSDHDDSFIRIEITYDEYAKLINMCENDLAEEKNTWSYKTVKWMEGAWEKIIFWN